MADAITKSSKTGRHEMAYVGEAPWHRLGQELTAGASLDVWTREAGMEWTITEHALKYGPQGEHVVPGKKVLARSDDNEALGVVSSRYKVVQPGEVIQFFDRLVTTEGFQLETAGTLFGGKRFWALAKVGPSFDIVKGDEVKPYMLLSTSADGSLATTARVTSVRVVCNNTLSLAVRKSQTAVTVRHVQQFDVDKVHQQLGFVVEQVDALRDAAKTLSKKKLDAKTAETFAAQFCLDANFVAAKELEDVRKSQPYQSIMSLFDGAGHGAQLRGVSGTAWGMVNAITEHVDHKMKGRSDDHRLANAWYGKGDAAKTLAVEKLLAI